MTIWNHAIVSRISPGFNGQTTRLTALSPDRDGPGHERAARPTVRSAGEKRSRRISMPEPAPSAIPALPVARDELRLEDPGLPRLGSRPALRLDLLDPH